MEIDRTLYPPDAESEVEARYKLPDRCLHIFDIEGAEARIDADDEHMLRAAVEEYIETGKDKLLDFTVIPTGADYTIRVSRVADWLVSSSQSRLISRHVQLAFKRAERASNLFDPEA